MALAASTSSSSSSSLVLPIPRTTPNKNTRRRTTSVVFAARRSDNYFSGRLVDENMIVLRKRIHEMQMMERNYEAPREWMDWEKGLYSTGYDSIICDAMGHLQSYLMETRPSLVLALAALIAFSVPTSTAVLVYNLLELTKGLGLVHL